MIEKMRDLYSALKEESKVLQTKFSQTSAEAIYYTFLNKQCGKDKLLKPTKQSKTNINNAKREKQKLKQKQKSKDNNNKKLNENVPKEAKKKSKSKKKKSDNQKDVAVATKPAKSGDGNGGGGGGGSDMSYKLVQALKENHCLVGWKKNAELAELSFLEHSIKKGKVKTGQIAVNTQRKCVENQCKTQSPDLKFVIEKSLSDDYRLCLKQKKNLEDDEIIYQKYLSHSSSASKSKAASKKNAK